MNDSWPDLLGPVLVSLLKVECWHACVLRVETPELMRRARIGAKTMHRDLSSQTGAESNSLCFVDESLKSLSTSAVVTSLNLHSEWTGGGRVEKSGTGASFLDSRIALTLFSSRGVYLGRCVEDPVFLKKV